MEIDIFSECAYTAAGIRHLINQIWAKNHAPAGFSRKRICFIDVTIVNFEARYRDEYANPNTYKIIIITDCLHEMVIIDSKTIILSNLISLSRFSHLIGDLYQRYSHYAEPPQLSRRESLFLSEWSTGKSLSDISSAMNIRSKTATHYKSRIMKKLGASRIKPLLHITRVRCLADRLNIRINKE
ncbi:LuxR C-terminal-related transcriptional regulator [Serratia nevei]|uniref:helix-turn-helix transcriptional regulator n=1 Tax=Serratia nevei TaxID=2703794 RepID=UPI00209D47FA|nr:LuxR C-terminal-related transcriptional regulator [Serratia nevei]MCP1106648.1 LuxR C-terminal-related transcriptional regulator [Serratia nevei]